MLLEFGVGAGLGILAGAAAVSRRKTLDSGKILILSRIFGTYFKRCAIATTTSTSKNNDLSVNELYAILKLVRSADHINSLISIAESQSSDGLISQSDFLTVAATKSEGPSTAFTSQEADILFRLAGAGTGVNRLPSSAFSSVFDNTPFSNSASPLIALPAPTTITPKNLTSSQKMGNEALKSAYNFTLGSVAGAIGATFVYPIGLFKSYY
jgi:solute carrier family 25 (mitochondrial aspartate/glutamate transporter), member 12/13